VLVGAVSKPRRRSQPQA